MQNCWAGLNEGMTLRPVELHTSPCCHPFNANRTLLQQKAHTA